MVHGGVFLIQGAVALGYADGLTLTLRLLGLVINRSWSHRPCSLFFLRAFRPGPAFPSTSSRSSPGLQVRPPWLSRDHSRSIRVNCVIGDSFAWIGSSECACALGSGQSDTGSRRCRLSGWIRRGGRRVPSRKQTHVAPICEFCCSPADCNQGGKQATPSEDVA